ncbi:MAG: hypothetical protein J5496_04775 [Lachnospiraceae bacterium]|nr:hypothetical protein [Lachnospiraceae bacterium]
MSFIGSNIMMEKLRRGEISIGTQIRSRNEMAVEIAGLLGFDFIYLETEHFMCNDETIENIARAAQGVGTVPLVRVPSQDPEILMHLLDAGVMGVIIPHVENGEEARRLVEACKYPPRGTRGSGMGSRAASYGLIPKNEYRELADKNTCVLFMIESEAAVNRIDEIIDSGVDVIRIGRNDLAESMGLKGNTKDPRVTQVVDYAISRCKAKGIPVGTAAGSVTAVQEAIAQGFTQISYASDLAILAKAWQKDLKSIHELLG